MTISKSAAGEAGPSITTTTELISATDQDNRFFRRFSWAILAFVILAFSGKAICDTADLPPITMMHHFHAITMGGWFVLFALQATLVLLAVRKMLTPTIVGGVLAFGPIWFLMQEWLTSFADKSPLPLWIYGGIMLLVVMLSSLVLLAHTIRALREHPARVLYHE